MVQLLECVPDNEKKYLNIGKPDKISREEIRNINTRPIFKQGPNHLGIVIDVKEINYLACISKSTTFQKAK